VFAFGAAPYRGSLPGDGVHVGDVVSVLGAAGGGGYWLVSSDGGVFAFGVPYLGSLPGLRVDVHDVVAAAGTATGSGYWLLGADGGVFAFGDAHFEGTG
jgi:hypothetical protein